MTAMRWLTAHGSTDGAPTNRIKPIRAALDMAQQICKEGPKMTPGVQKAFGKALKGRKVMQQWWVDDEDPSDSGQVEETERHKAWISM